ncbi:MAG: FG-GAP-like repeat-containing protein [Polyangiaceae bacterium]
MRRFSPVALHLVALTALGLGACNVADSDSDDPQDQDEAVGEASSAVTLPPVTPFSVVVASDPQLWWSIDNIVGSDAAALGWSDATMEAFGDMTNLNQVHAINWLADGTISINGYAKPSFVIMNGDLTEYGRTKQRNAFQSYYMAQGSLKVPVYIGLGNHDIGGNIHGDCWPDADEVADAGAQCLTGDCTRADQMGIEKANWCGNEMRRWTEGWIHANRTWLNSYDPGSLAYSWSKNGVRFLELHNYASYSEPDFHISDSLAYVRNELTIAVSLGERVVVNLHDFGVDSGSATNVKQIAAEDQSLIDTLKGFEYNVIAIFSGHVHYVAGFQKSVNVNGINIPWFRSGSATWNHVALAQFNATGLKVMSVSTANGFPVAEPNGAHIVSPYNPSYTFDSTPEYSGNYPVNPCSKGYQPAFAGGTCLSTGYQTIRSGMALGYAQPGDETGQAVAKGDFNGDGVEDLAVASPHVRQGADADAGAINILYGSPFTGLTAAANARFSLASAGVPGDTASGDLFGAALAAGDFNGDGKTDLAVGAPGRSVNGHSGAGEVFVLFGSASGITGNGAQEWSQESPYVEGSAEAGDNFGSSLAAGDFNGDGKADLAVGVPYEDLYGYDDGGTVHVFMGSPLGLSTAGDPMFDQNSAGVQGGVESYDKFGWALAAGDFNGDGKADLAIGVPYEDVDGNDDAGAVHVFQGTSNGLSPAFDPMFTQDSPNVAGGEEGNDRFGYALAAGDFNGDGKMDLAIGVPGEDLPGGDDAGTVSVFMGTAGGLSAVGDPGFDQDSQGVPGHAESGDHLGWSLCAGDFNGDHRADLVVGVPDENLNSLTNGGAVDIFYGAPGAQLTAASTAEWSETW